MKTSLEAAVRDTWKLLPLPPDAYRYAFAKDGRRVVGTWVPSPSALARFADIHSWADVYVQLNPARTRNLRRPAARDVSWVQAILIDIDPVETDALPGLACVRTVGALISLGVPLACMSIIDSGRGRQVWIHVDPIPVVGEGSLARCVRRFVQAVTAAVGTAYGCRIDTCADLSRLARMPGTVNQKTGRTTGIVREGRPVPAFFLFGYDADEEVAGALTSPPSCARSRWPDIYPHLTRLAKEYILEGVSEPGRHKACVAAARSLLEAHVEQTLALTYLRLGALRCDPPLADDDFVCRVFRETFGVTK